MHAAGARLAYAYARHFDLRLRAPDVLHLGDCPSRRCNPDHSRSANGGGSPRTGHRRRDPRTEPSANSEPLARSHETYDIHADVDVWVTYGSVGSIDGSDVPRRAGFARHQGTYARCVGRGGCSPCRSGLRARHRGGGGGAAQPDRRVQRASSRDIADRRRMSPQGIRDLGGTRKAQWHDPAPEGAFMATRSERCAKSSCSTSECATPRSIWRG